MLTVHLYLLASISRVILGYELLTLSIVRDIRAVLDLHFYGSFVQSAAVGVDDGQRKCPRRNLLDRQLALLVKGKNVERLVFVILAPPLRHGESDSAIRTVVVLENLALAGIRVREDMPRLVLLFPTFDVSFAWVREWQDVKWLVLLFGLYVYSSGC